MSLSTEEHSPIESSLVMGLPARRRTWALPAGSQAERARARPQQAARLLAEARLPAEARRPQEVQPRQAALAAARPQEAALVAPAEQLPAQRPGPARSAAACRCNRCRRRSLRR
jgi:hypothetical protein